MSDPKCPEHPAWTAHWLKGDPSIGVCAICLSHLMDIPNRGGISDVRRNKKTTINPPQFIETYEV